MKKFEVWLARLDAATTQATLAALSEMFSE